MGRSGAGKSTLLNLISGIDQPTSGRVRIGHTDLTDKSETERTCFRRAHIGFVFQSFNLISTLTVGENVRLPLELAGAASGADQDRARAMLDRVGLADRANQFPDRLSGGEQQRVAVARALAHEPFLVLADEPPGNLDYETGQALPDSSRSDWRTNQVYMVHFAVTDGTNKEFYTFEQFQRGGAGLDANIAFHITPYLPDQELDVSVRYWEGAVRVKGSATGRGYVEMTGYGDSPGTPRS